APAVQGIQRFADVPIYRKDAMVRRSEPLQATTASRAPKACVAASLLQALNLQAGDLVKIASDQGQITLPCEQDDTVASNCVRIAAAFNETIELGSSFGKLTVERA